MGLVIDEVTMNKVLTLQDIFDELLRDKYICKVINCLEDDPNNKLDLQKLHECIQHFLGVNPYKVDMSHSDLSFLHDVLYFLDPNVDLIDVPPMLSNRYFAYTIIEISFLAFLDKNNLSISMQALEYKYLLQFDIFRFFAVARHDLDMIYNKIKFVKDDSSAWDWVKPTSIDIYNPKTYLDPYGSRYLDPYIYGSKYIPDTSIVTLEPFTNTPIESFDCTSYISKI